MGNQVEENFNLQEWEIQPSIIGKMEHQRCEILET
jgi:hypothetical protein